MEHPYWETHIPSLKLKRKLIGNYNNIPINFTLELNAENYIDIRDAGLSGFNHYFNPNNPPYYQTVKGSIKGLYLRKSVVKKLTNINDRLGQKGIELFFFDCYRPVKVQQFLYNIWLPNYLVKIHPNLSKEKLFELRDQYSAKAPISNKDIDSNSPPPHTTGAAMDVTLRFKDSKNMLFMGTIYDDSSYLTHTDYFESLLPKKILTLSEEEALKNRRILYHSMKTEGFENYPYEWWHYSWGDQMWALLSGNNEAFYSNMNL